MMTRKSAYNEGREAGAAGRASSGNPYSFNLPELARSWRRGWLRGVGDAAEA